MAINGNLSRARPRNFHQPTDRRNLLKEETDFRHGTIYADWPPMGEV